MAKYKFICSFKPAKLAFNKHFPMYRRKWQLEAYIPEYKISMTYKVILKVKKVILKIDTYVP